jgi:hypothetical protein
LRPDEETVTVGDEVRRDSDDRDLADNDAIGGRTVRCLDQKVIQVRDFQIERIQEETNKLD